MKYFPLWLVWIFGFSSMDVAAKEVSIDVSMEIVCASGDMIAEILIENPTNSEIILSKYTVGYQGYIFSDVFEVTLDGSKIEYSGEMLSPVLDSTAFITLQPGGIYSLKVNLAKYYDVQPGYEYKVGYKAYSYFSSDSLLYDFALVSTFKTASCPKNPIDN